MKPFANPAFSRSAHSLGILLAVCAMPQPARAGLPRCASHMQEPPEGGVLTPDQISINSACLQALADFEKVAEIKAKIEEADHRKDHTQNPTPAGTPFFPTFGGPGFPGSRAPAPQDPVAARPAAQPVTPPPPRDPRVSMIEGDDHGHYSATLRLPDGGTVEVGRGSLLPDGAQVAIIDADTVYIRRGKTLFRLPLDDGQALQPVAEKTGTAPGVPSLTPSPGLFPGAPMGGTFR